MIDECQCHQHAARSTQLHGPCVCVCAASLLVCLLEFILLLQLPSGLFDDPPHARLQYRPLLQRCNVEQLRTTTSSTYITFHIFILAVWPCPVTPGGVQESQPGSWRRTNKSHSHVSVQIHGVHQYSAVGVTDTAHVTLHVDFGGAICNAILQSQQTISTYSETRASLKGRRIEGIVFLGRNNSNNMNEQM